MRYAIARHNRTRREMAYRIYITDLLRNADEKISALTGGSYFNVRYAELIGESRKEEKSKSFEDIRDDVLKRSGLELID